MAYVDVFTAKTWWKKHGMAWNALNASDLDDGRPKRANNAPPVPEIPRVERRPATFHVSGASVSRVISIPSNIGFGDRLPTFGLGTQQASFTPLTQQTQQAMQGEDETDFKPPMGAHLVVPPGENLVSSSNPSNPATPESPTEQGVGGSGTQPGSDCNIATWLTSLGLTAYLDGFHARGLYNMYELQEFSLEDLQKMKIGTTHRNKIWRSLVEFRNAQNFPPTQLSAQHSGSSTSTSSVTSQGGGAYCPGFYEVTRYTFKHTISLKDDHDYCK